MAHPTEFELWPKKGIYGYKLMLRDAEISEYCVGHTLVEGEPYAQHMFPFQVFSDSEEHAKIGAKVHFQFLMLKHGVKLKDEPEGYVPEEE
jgi:hypothetical protein